MKKLVILALTVTLVSVVSQAYGGAPSQPVEVVNQPVDVNVVNTATNPALVRDVNDAWQPFQKTATLIFEDGERGASGGFTVPSNKRLVIEHVSATGAIGNAQRIFQTQITTLQVGGGSEATHYLVATFQGTHPCIGNYFAISQPMRLYAVGAVKLATFRTDDAGVAQVNVSVSGYLVDVP